MDIGNYIIGFGLVILLILAHIMVALGSVYFWRESMLPTNNIHTTEIKVLAFVMFVMFTAINIIIFGIEVKVMTG